MDKPIFRLHSVDDFTRRRTLILANGTAVDETAYDLLRNAVNGIEAEGCFNGHTRTNGAPVELQSATAMSMQVQSYWGAYRVTVEYLPDVLLSGKRGT